MEARLIKSRERVQQHGEVFTPRWMVLEMLSHPTVQEKIADLHATFFEPSAGEGAFLTEILRQRLALLSGNRSPWGRGRNWPYDALWAVSTIYGIEYLPDNLAVSRAAMEKVFREHYAEKFQRELPADSDLYRSLRTIVAANIVQGDTLTHRNAAGDWIVFSEWRQSAKAKRKRFCQRLPFYYDELFEADSAEIALFSEETRPPLPCYKEASIIDVWKEEQA